VTDHQPDDDFLSAARRAHGPISEDEIKQGEEMLALGDIAIWELEIGG
jgi:hypothetical protein